MQRLALAAKASATALVVGYAERDGTRVYNSAACFGPDGGRLANHRKLQLYGPRERSVYVPGDTYTTFRTSYEVGGDDPEAVLDDWREAFVASGPELRKVDPSVQPVSAYLGLLG